MEEIYQAMRVKNVIYQAVKPELHIFDNIAFYLTFQLPWPWL
jgi:hypothetical protein